MGKICKKKTKYAHSRVVSPFNFLPFQLRPFVCKFEIHPPIHLHIPIYHSGDPLQFSGARGGARQSVAKMNSREWGKADCRILHIRV